MKKGKQILEVGCGDIPNELVGESTEVVDYGEGTICPGFGDTHTFFTGYVVDYLGVDLSEAVNLKQIVERLSENLEMNPETVVLFGNHLQPELAEKINKGGLSDIYFFLILAAIFIQDDDIVHSFSNLFQD